MKSLYRRKVIWEKEGRRKKIAQKQVNNLNNMHRGIEYTFTHSQTGTITILIYIV